MTIRPVTSATLVSNLNQLNFEGKKKKNPNASQPISQVSHKLAVPLAATVLAMSPMASSGKGIQVPLDNVNSIEMIDSNDLKGRKIDEKTFIDSDANSLNMTTTIGLVNTKDNSRNFDKIMYGVSSTVNLGGFLESSYDEKPVTDYSDIVFDLMSDDGTKGLSFNVKSINVEGNSKPFFDKEKVAYVESAIKSPNNKTDVEVHKYRRTLRHDLFGMQNIANNNIMKDAIPKTSYGNLEGEQEVEVGNDKYVLGYYSTDGDSSTAELVTVRKNGNPELCVRGIVFYNATINPESSNPQKFKYSLVRLEGAENKGYSLIDDNLANVLVQVLCDSQFKNATKNTYVMELDSEYMTTTKGVLMPIKDVK